MTKLIAEVGTANGGDREWILESVARCAAAGIWGYKIQLYRPEWLATPTAPTYGNHDLIKEPEHQYDHFSKPFPISEVGRTAELCREYGLEFFASVFDEAMIAPCEEAGVRIYKVASADITHKPLIQAIARTGKDIFMSTGAATLDEVRRAHEWILGSSPHSGDQRTVVFACPLQYPTTESRDSKIDTLLWMAENLQPGGLQIGYSDHTLGTDVTRQAAWIGADFIEKHITITPGLGGDHDFAVSPEDFGACLSSEPIDGMTQQALKTMVALPPRLLESERPAHEFARRSICSVVYIPRKARIENHMLRVLRPGTGMEPFLIDDPNRTPIGKKASVNIPAWTPLTEDMFGFVSASLTVI